MRRRCLAVLTGLICLGLLLSWSGSAAKADPRFRKQFEELYVKKDSAEPSEQAFAAKVKKAKCNLCHVGRNRKMRNAYGAELSKLLDRKKDAKNVEKIRKAMATVAEIKANPDDENSPTFGELIAQGELPASEEVSGN